MERWAGQVSKLVQQQRRCVSHIARAGKVAHQVEGHQHHAGHQHRAAHQHQGRSITNIARFGVERWEGWDNLDALNLSCSESEPLKLAEVDAMLQKDDELRGVVESMTLGYGNQLGSELLRNDISCHVYNGSVPIGNINVLAPSEG